MTGRRLHLASVLVVALLALVGASAGGARTNETTMSMVAYFSNPTAQYNIQQIVNAFTAKNPDVKINISFVPAGQIDQVIGTMVAAGNLPDIVFTTPGTARTSGVRSLAEKGLLLPFSLTKQKWTQKIPPGLRNVVGIGKTIYGWPQEANFEGAFYNLDALRKAGATPPNTWTKVLQYCARMKAAGITPYGMDLADVFGGYQLFYSLIASTVYHKTPNWDALRHAKKTTFAKTPGFAEALRKMLQMRDAGCFQSTPSGDNLSAVQGKLISGSIGGWPFLSSITASIYRTAPDANIEYFPFPAYDKRNAVVAGPLTVWSINKKTQYRTTALKLMEFVSSISVNGFWGRQANALSMVYYKTQKLPKHFDASFKPFLKANAVYGIPGLLWEPGVQDTALGPGIQALFLGRQSVEDVVKSLDETWDRVAASK